MKFDKTAVYLFIIALLILVGEQSDAQRRNYRFQSSKPFEYGLNGGVIFSNLIPDHNPNTSYKTGYYAGGYFDYNLKNNFSLMAELNFKASGGESVPASLIFNPSAVYLRDVNSIDLTMYSAEVPVSIKYNIKTIFPEAFIGAGICAAYNIKSQAALFYLKNIGNSYTSSTTYVDVTDKVQKLVGSVIINMGAKIPMDKINLTIKGEVQYNINNLGNNNEVIYNGFRTKAFKFGIGVGF